MNYIIIERVENFDLLWLIFNEHMLWKHHIYIIANKSTTFPGILNKFKRFLPGYIVRLLYLSMVQSQLLYNTLAWGFGHSEPRFQQFEILEIDNLFDLNCLRFVYNHKKRDIPHHFLNFRYEQRYPIHDHDTRFANFIDATFLYGLPSNMKWNKTILICKYINAQICTIIRSWHTWITHIHLYGFLMNQCSRLNKTKFWMITLFLLS